MIMGDDIDPEEEMAAVEGAASDRALKEQEEALRNRLNSRKHGQGKEESSSGDEETSSYEPPKQAKKQKSMGRTSGTSFAKGTPEPKNSVTFPSSMWPPGMSAQQVSKILEHR